MSTNRLYNIFEDMKGPKFKGLAYNRPIPPRPDVPGSIVLPSLGVIGYLHNLCGGWIWYTVWATATGDVVKHVPANCSCCRVPLDGPKLARLIQRELNFDNHFNDAPGTVDLGENPCMGIDIPKFSTEELDEMRERFLDSLDNLGKALNNPAFDVMNEEGDDDEWKKGKR